MPYELWLEEKQIVAGLKTEDWVQIPAVQLRRGHHQFIRYGVWIDYTLNDNGLTFDLEACTDNRSQETFLYFPSLVPQFPDDLQAARLSALKARHLSLLRFSAFENPDQLPNTVAQVFSVPQNLVTEFVWKKVAGRVFELS